MSRLVDIRDIFLEEKTLPMNEVLSIVSAGCFTTRERILAGMDAQIVNSHLQQIKEHLEERKKGKPVAYITRVKEFYSQDFFVDENVLIPRPETELLVDEALLIIRKDKQTTNILDMGTGSGAIGLTISAMTSKKVFCVDVSEKALSVARKNATKMGVRVDFLCSNLFEGIKTDTRFDMILANLPYVSDSDWEALTKEVKDFEPRLALWGGKEGMEIYREFVSSAARHMNRSGHVLCEIGGCHQASLMKDLLMSNGFQVQIRKDYAGLERVIIAKWINS